MMKKDLSLSLIQIVSAVAVVTLHTNGCFWSFSATERYWFSANIIECVFYFAVPLFFMVTGITLLDYQEKYSTKIFFLKRFEKTVIPYLFWSLFGIVFLILTDSMSADQITFRWVLNGLLSTSGIISIYWFFQPLFCLYLSIPLFSAIEKPKKNNIIKYLVILSLAFNTLIPFINNVFSLGISWSYQFSVASGYLFWMLTGWYIYNNPPSMKVKILIYALAALGLFAHIAGTYILSMQAGSVQSLYKGYLNLPCVLYSLGIFVLLYDVGKIVKKSKVAERMLLFLGKYTFPLYLLHWFVMRLFVIYLNMDSTLLSYRLLMPYLIFAIVIGVTLLLRKIPVLKKVLP